MRTVEELEAALAAKMAERPAQPEFVSKMAPKDYAVFSEAMRAWVFERDELRTALDIARNIAPSMSQTPVVVPKVDYWTGPDMRDR